MNSTALEKLRYPIGKTQFPQTITKKDVTTWIRTLEEFPLKLQTLVAELSDNQLDTPYREGGWTIRQVIHHLADSHHHSYIRFKWTLTEDTPIIKAYYEDRWANLHDTKSAPILLSLNALESTHAKLVYLLKGLSENDLDQSFIHPETKEAVQLRKNIAIYAWHSNHHYAHIENVMLQKGWLTDKD